MRVYLAGECSSRWLGCDWRAAWSTELRAAGRRCEWPAGLDARCVGDAARCARLRAAYAARPRAHWRRICAQVLSCDAVLVRLEGAGAGTRAEAALALAAGVRVVAVAGTPRVPWFEPPRSVDVVPDLPAAVRAMAVIATSAKPTGPGTPG